MRRNRVIKDVVKEERKEGRKKRVGRREEEGENE